MHLPFSEPLPVSKLAASFGNTSATYKFYWLLGIVELVEEGDAISQKLKLLCKMKRN